MTAAPAPLAGLRVIDASHVLAGPYATFLLAALGAEVVKIERPGEGDGIRNLATQPEKEGLTSSFAAVNAGKRSLSLDLSTAEGREVLERLIPTAAVFVENFRPGKMAALGFGPERVRALNPGIVYCSISAWGQDGPLAARGGYDHVMQAATGMMMLQGEDPAAPPVKVGFPVVDMATGMMGAIALLAGLLQRRRDPDGPVALDVSMADAALCLMAGPATAWLHGGPAPARVGNNGFVNSPGASVFRTADGWISVAANTLGQFDAMCAILGRPELATAPDYLAIRPDDPAAMLRNLATPALRDALRDSFAGRGSAEWEGLLNAAGVPAAAVRGLADYLDGPYRETAGIGLDLPDGADPVLGPGFRWSGRGPVRGDAPPRLGRDNDALLAEIGFPPERVAALRAAGIVD